MASSICPSCFSNVKIHTPKTDPARPPTNNTYPILKSTLPRRQCISTPETEAPTSWLADEATACAVVLCAAQRRNAREASLQPAPRREKRQPGRAALCLGEEGPC